jgi:hypothetical protein
MKRSEVFERVVMMPMKIKLRDKYYEGLNKGDPMHWRNVGPDEIWDAAWQAAMTAMRKESNNYEEHRDRMAIRSAIDGANKSD